MNARAQNRRDQLQQIAAMKEQARAELSARLEAEIEANKEAGNVWINGEWVPQSQAKRVRRRVIWRGLTIFVETQFAILLVLIIGLVFWLVFTFLLTPYPPLPRMGMKPPAPPTEAAQPGTATTPESAPSTAHPE